MNDIKQIMLNLGFSNITELGKEYRSRPIYRDSDNHTVLSVKKDTGYFVDYARGISGPLEKLVQLCLSCSLEDAKKWLESDQGFIVKKRHVYDIPDKVYKTLSTDTFDDVIVDHSYWLDRGVKKKTIETFEGGIFKKGKMKNRYTFPIFDLNKKLIGVSGRYIYPIKKDFKIPKWKHIGEKSKWQYPVYFNGEIIKKESSAIIVESIGDMLSLWNAGFKNVIVSFGLNLSFAIINSLIKFDVNTIIVAFNNDENLAGHLATEKAKKKLLKFFDKNQIQLLLPTKNDFGEMTPSEIVTWATQIK
tara:strand:- start:10685 stop:11593 length:909 start_codon:yes stop_codon:yes gene_type:complete